MHIAIATTEFVTESFFSGGLGNYTANLATLLASHGDKVDIFVLSNIDECFNWREGVLVHRVRYSEDVSDYIYSHNRVIHFLLQAFWDLFGASHVINKAIKLSNEEDRLDIIQYCDAGALGLMKLKGVPNVVRLSSYPVLLRKANCEEFNFDSALHGLNMPEMTRLLALRRAKRLICPSMFIAKIVEKKIKREITVIESPISIDINKMDDTLYEKLIGNKKYFLFYGTLGYIKGIHVIASILPELFRRYEDVYFVFVGANTKMSWNSQYIDASDYVKKRSGDYIDRVIYIEAISNKSQLFSIINHAYACVFPSRVDNLPNTCIESMALGKIVIGTDGASFEQLIINGYNGWLIERDNSIDLLEKIETLMRMTEDERALFGERAKKRICSMQPNTIYDRMKSIYWETINEAEGNRRNE